MDIEVRFPKQDRLSRGRNGFAETSGIWLSAGYGEVELYPITGKGERSEAARLVVPFTHLRDLRDALNDMLTHVEAIEGRRRAVAMGDKPADQKEEVQESFDHDPAHCPSDHWNRGDDICEDCGTFLG